MSGSRHRERLRYLKSIAKTEIFNNLELATFIFLFLILGYVFFPKGKIEKLISNPNDTNFELSKLYLERLLNIKFDPNLALLLVEREIQLGNYKEAIKTLEKYRENFKKLGKFDEYLREKYRILKLLYFSQKNKKEKEKILEEIKKNLIQLLQVGDIDEKKFVYEESIKMNIPKVALIAAEELAKETGKEDWYIKEIQLAISLKDLNTAIKIIEKLKYTNPKLLKEGILIASKQKNKKVLRNLAIKLIRTKNFSSEDLKFLIWLSLAEKDSFLLKEICQKALKEKKDSKTIILCLKAALWIKDYRWAKKIIQNNLERFSKDPETLKELLKVARMLNDSKLQILIADKLLKLLEIMESK